MRGFAPLIHHASSRISAFRSTYIALSLYELLDREGIPKFASLDEVSEKFRFHPDNQIIVSGVHQDFLLERVWRSQHRPALAKFLKTINVAVLTSPNFSVYNNVPRTENLYNIKRIGRIAREFLEAGVPTALHVNACTDFDYEQYASFLRDREEYQAISFEFVTGPGYPSRMWWHIKKLIELQTKVGRQLQLVMRGGTRAISALSSSYSDILVIDSDPLHRALHRQRMVFGNDGRMRYVKNHLPEGTPIDDLLVQNVGAATQEIDSALRRVPMNLAKRLKNLARRACDMDNEAGQLNLLTDPPRGQARAGAVNAKSMIATAKSQGATDIYKSAKKSTKTASVARRAAKPRSAVR
jgi:hypothetical protein